MQDLPSRSRQTRSLLRRGCAIAIACVVAGACTRAPLEVRPVASLGSTPEAGAAFDRIRRAWERGDRDDRAKLRTAIEQFLIKFPKDGLAPVARAYLTFLAMDANNWDKARTLLNQLKGMPPGSTANLVDIATARFLRHEKRADEALDVMRPLVGKVVDPVARELFLEEVSLDAVEAHRDYEAVAYMDEWLRGVPEDAHDSVRTKIATWLAALPSNVLQDALRAMRANNASTGYGAEIQKLVGVRLAEIAVSSNDSTLARWLLDNESGTSFIVSDAGVSLGELATSRRGLSSVSGRTIGLLVPTGSTDLRDEAADVARGVAWALGFPRVDSSLAADAGKGDEVRFVTRDSAGDRERTDAAMDELAGEGAAIVIAGVDRAAGTRAMAWGAEHGMPVICLSSPTNVKANAFSFVVGEPRSSELTALADSLATRGVTKVALVSAADSPAAEQAIVTGHDALQFVDPVACDVSATRAGEARFPLDAWAKANVRGWIVSGPVECARDLLSELISRSSGGPPVLVGLTLEAASSTVSFTRDDGAALRTGGSVVAISVAAGVIPVLATKPDDVADEDVRAYMTSFGARPNYWTALGRDAATLARKAIRTLPLDATTDPRVVAERRAKSQSQLAEARARLWTTDADGFDAAHVLPRSLHVIDFPIR